MTRKKPILQPTPKQHSIRARFSSASDRSFASINLYAYNGAHVAVKKTLSYLYFIL